ncbi:uncharacterized protein GGS22DRAFT_124374 [Annulohypoxylon maeteangense]|uniref:uncharacterized protein n=1 Tax=Annulohypoxylon maeteangense TaxID=1927788 RepID=UPI00200749B9|nr:uncharacterized protein GGS22DRAFT_124374 [Annulohypoxylon maeteangense]KAI0886109.1 hypothetical protein GGS22DRAFT_124374 [Annulohypoxylon maeteangense]
MYPPMGISDITILELLDSDPRPSFVVITTQTSLPIYANPALRQNAVLHDQIVKLFQSRHGPFWDWVTAALLPDTGTGHTFPFENVFWTRSIVRDKWAVIGSNNHPPLGDVERNNNKGPLQEAASPEVLKDHNDSWIPPDFLPEQESFAHVINTLDWALTPLGPLPRWPGLLQQTFNQVLADSRPIVIYWGESLTTLYNEAFSKLCGSRHPSLLGKSVENAWPDFHEKIKSAMSTSASKFRAGSNDEDEWRFFTQNPDGHSEEKYLKWSIIPVTDKNRCLGFIQPIQDNTSMRLWERRTRMLIDLGDMLVTARDVRSYWAKLIQGLEACHPTYDIPLAILYSLEEDFPLSTGKTCRLEGCLGVPNGHPMAPSKLRLDERSQGLSLSFRQTLESQNPLLLRIRDGTLPKSLLEGLKWRGFEDPCREAVICPIRPTKEENVLGFLFLGLNPRRPYDNDYRQYISLLGQKLTTTLASAVLLEEEARRRRNIAEQAAYDQARLKEKLTTQTREATESVQKFQQIAEFLPVGMCFGNYRGNIIFANDAWRRITGAPQVNPLTPEGFLSCVIDEDKPNVRRAYEELHKTLTVTIEFRVPRPADDSYPLQFPIGSSPSFEKAGLNLDDEGDVRHVLGSLKAERGSDGNINQVLACLTDVTLHKKAAEEAIRKAQQAENLKRMAELATVGMYDMALDGRLLGANNVFYEMCGIDRVDLAQESVKPFEFCVVDEDLTFLKNSLVTLVREGKPQTAELRLKTQWTETDTDGDQIVAPRWVLATFMPVSNSEGAIQTFTGCLSDVSLQKWQFEKERQRKDEAIESKRQQENFIDMTSHEMRNPLSAIIQCADAVIGCLTKAQELVDTQFSKCGDGGMSNPPPPTPDALGGICQESTQLLKDSIDNAETIIACAQHQKRIVDDILTMSKLDSNLLSITPITVNPINIAREAFKMFEVEARRVDIDLTMIIDRSYTELNVEFLDLDPSRLKQVLINLLTNALKFTKNGPTRNVSITMSASKARPEDRISSVQFIPRATDLVWQGSGSSSPVPEETRIYLMFEVKDTGQGLTKEEKSSLFQRFVQANSKTHVKYGGSGLGLFISRRLTEMQNGAIGVASNPGQGSTFAFYIEAQVPSEEAFQDARAAAEAVGHILRNPNTWDLGDRGSNKGPFTMAKPTKKLLGPQIEGVLLVEDNLINQQITRRDLLTSGCAVEVANHGIEALEKLQHTNRGGGKFPLSLILMDIEMPVQDGLTCTRKIRELERMGHFKGPRIPIIAVSANARMEQILEAKAAGCDDVLVKPFRILELIEKMMVVTRQLEKARQEGT